MVLNICNYVYGSKYLFDNVYGSKYVFEYVYGPKQMLDYALVIINQICNKSFCVHKENVENNLTTSHLFRTIKVSRVKTKDIMKRNINNNGIIKHNNEIYTV